MATYGDADNDDDDVCRLSSGVLFDVSNFTLPLVLMTHKWKDNCCQIITIITFVIIAIVVFRRPPSLVRLS
eukprot:5488515-Pyramimonas_sp.AAC.1